MNRVFVDTSAVYALLVQSDLSHSRAERAFARLREGQAPLVTSSYVLVECCALLGRRVGMEAAEAFRDDFHPLIDTVWVDRALHERALDLFLERGMRDLSLVDAVSFLIAREHGIEEFFGYDRHFVDEGLVQVG